MLTAECCASATSRPPRSQEFVLHHKFGICFPGGDHLPSLEKTYIRRLIENFAEHRQYNINQISQTHHPCSSLAKRLATNGVSFTPACLRPDSTFPHSKTDSSSIRITITSRNPVTIASRRSLKISREASRVGAEAAR